MLPSLTRFFHVDKSVRFTAALHLASEEKPVGLSIGKFAELTIHDKMYLLYLTVLHLSENDGCMKTTDISPENRTAKKNLPAA